MNRKADEKLISVIVPVYNGEAYLEACLKSICRQSYRNLEIIVVDDGSRDGSVELIRRLAAEDSRIKLCEHGENKGLFGARITGFHASHGDYIGFVDSDDEVSIDWFRLLYQTAEEQGNDITAGLTYETYSDGRWDYLNLSPLRHEMSLSGKDVFRAFIEQEGGCTHWQTLWNKLYSRRVWLRVLPEVEAFAVQHPRFVMCEDLAFSSALWLRAERMGNIPHGAVYFYHHHEGASTAISTDREAILKKLRDTAGAFGFMGEQMQKCGVYEEYAEHYESWKRFYAEIYFGLLQDCGGDTAADTQDVCGAFGYAEDTALERPAPERNYFNSVRSLVDRELFERMERAKELICSDKIDVVSFDIFDTLILRPLWTPTDLFYLMNVEFNRLFEMNSYVPFSEIRVSAEKECRKRIVREHADYEDVTLDEIYEQIALDYALDASALARLKELEQELELRFCTARRTGKQLFDLAVSQGKRVILCSDMYLPRQTVDTILQKNGYTYDEIYLSSELRVGKWTKHLFARVQEELSPDPTRFLHIGDNLDSDVRHPAELGWHTLHLPKPIDLFCGNAPECYQGELYARMMRYRGATRDSMNPEWAFLGYRCAMALAANKLCDDPFTTVARDSDFDADPYRIGYLALGHYLYAVTDWIIEKAKREGAKKIHFVARDGYLPMEAYRIFGESDPTLPNENYLYVSRKALALADVYHAADLYSFRGKFPVSDYSPAKLERIMKPYYRDGVESILQTAEMREEEYNARFADQAAYDRTVRLISECVDFEKLKAQKQALKDYFVSLIGKEDLLFDIGYSGRAEAALTRLLGYPVNSLYVHGVTQALHDRSHAHGFRTDCFYGVKPCITGVIREHVFMKQAPSAIGYEATADGGLMPKFEDYHVSAAERVFTSALQNAALDFVRDMRTVFAGHTELLAYRGEDLAFSFEYYLHYAKPKDRRVFGCVTFEDEMGLGKQISALDVWEADLERFRLDRYFKEESFDELSQDEKLRNTFMAYPRWKKALCYLLLDRGHFKGSLKKVWHKLVGR